MNTLPKLLTACTVILFAGNIHAEVLNSFTEPYEKSDLATGDVGVVRTISVSLGDAVAEGQMIASLDTRNLEASLKIARLRAASSAKIEAAEARLQQATRKQEKLEKISASGHATSNELEIANTDVIVAAAELKLAKEEKALNEADVERIVTEIERRITRSPFSGIVTHIHRRVGEFVSATDPNVATVVQLDRLRVKFFVRSELARRLHKGDTVSVELEGSIIEATVDFVSPVTDSDSNATRVDVVLLNPGHKLRSGIACRLVLAASEQSRSLTRSARRTRSDTGRWGR